MVRLSEGKGHPRTAGTEARVLSHYVRETKQLTLMDAIRKMTLMPAQRLEKLAPVFQEQGTAQSRRRRGHHRVRSGHGRRIGRRISSRR